MPTYLYIHESRTESPQRRFRSEYELRAMDYELRREVSSKGEIISDIAGGNIRAVIDGFGDDNLFGWLFRADVEESGEIVTTDLHERVMEKFVFTGAKAVGYRLHFDANTKDAVAAILTIEAREITTDSELNYLRRR